MARFFANLFLNVIVTMIMIYIIKKLVAGRNIPVLSAVVAEV